MRFFRFHRTNPHVFRSSKSWRRQMKATGRKIRGRTIIEKMRWDYDIKTTGDVFKINNDFVAIYVRLLIHRYPKDLMGFLSCAWA